MLIGQQKPKYRRPVKIRTPENIRKVQKMASQCNQPSLKGMAMKIGTSGTTIGKMIDGHNHMVTRIKRKVHKLNDEQKQNRKTNARKLYEHISTQMITNYKDVEESYAVDISVTTKYFFTETRTGASYRKTVEDIANQTKSISYVNAAIAAYEINLEPHWSNDS